MKADLTSRANRRTVLWAGALPVVFGLLAVFLLNKSSADTRLCPSSALACWSSGNAGYLGIPIAFGAIFLGLIWFACARRLTAALKLFVAVSVAAALIVTAWGTYRDGEQYKAITVSGLLVKGSGSPPAFQPWSETSTVLASCETGSRSGPKLELLFRLRNGGDVEYEYNNWVALSRAHPSLVAATNSIPYRTRNIGLCDRNYIFLPMVGLNTAPPSVDAGPRAPLGFLLALLFLPVLTILIGMFLSMRKAEQSRG